MNFISFELIHLFKHYIWKKIQEDIRKNNIPHSDKVNYIDDFERVISVGWEIIKNALTSDLDISIFIEGLPEDDSKQDTSIVDVQITIPSQESCSVEAIDVNIVNWSEVLDSEYDALPEKIKTLWNT